MNKYLPHRLRTLRESRGMSRRTLSELCGLSKKMKPTRKMSFARASRTMAGHMREAHNSIILNRLVQQ